MTSTTSTNGSTRSNVTARRARSLVLSLTGVAAATAATAGLALGPSTAQADPGDTFVPIGSSQLLQSEDLASDSALRVDKETVRLGIDPDFSSCAGEGSSMSDIVKSRVQPVSATWTSRRVRNQTVYESIAQAATPAQAKRLARRLLTATVRDCQRPKYDFHYGPTSESGVGSGFTTWAVSYRGNASRPDGGVAVFSKGTNFGFLEVSLPSESTAEVRQSVEGLAKEAVHRLA